MFHLRLKEEHMLGGVKGLVVGRDAFLYLHPIISIRGICPFVSYNFRVKTGYWKVSASFNGRILFA